MTHENYRWRPALYGMLLLSGATIALAGADDSATLTSRTQVSQYGITWQFDRSERVGQFVNGDYYVVGPVTVIGIDPAPQFGTNVPARELGEREKRARKRDGGYVRNGSMLNPPASREVAYDSGIRNFFKPERVAVLPIVLRPGDSLVSTISLKTGEEATYPYHGAMGSRDHHDNSPLKTAAILTCVGEPLAKDAFRPSYGDRNQKVYFARNLFPDRLPRLKPPKSTPSLDTWIRVFQRPWINTCFFGFEQPTENMPQYGQWVGQAQSMAGLLLMLDLPAEQKQRLLINMVQVGIDYWGLVRSGHPGWEGHGGHGSGRKFPIVFAGLMLGDAEMASPTRAFPRVEFGEDNQTMYGTGWTGAKALFAGHSGIRSATGKAARAEWGPYEHLPPRDWIRGNVTSEAYRRANTSSSWVGQALGIQLMGGKESWGHDAFFDYVDRWMREAGDAGFRAEIMKHHPKELLDDKHRWTHQGTTWEPFVKDMWNAYRDSVLSVPRPD